MPKWTPTDISNLSGKRAIVTGGNSGIGLVASRELARAGAEVTLACRDGGRAESAATAIRAAAPKANVIAAVLDLADLASIRGFADSQAEPLDLLINNAGVMAPPKRRLTRDGFELQMGTNHLGHFALTGLLLPLITAAPAARVVNVASIAHRGAKIFFDDLQAEKSYKGFDRYRQSKLANLLFGFELQRYFERTHSTATSIVVHPGVSRTNLFRPGIGASLGPLMYAVDLGMLMFAQSAEKGALPTLYAATSPDAKGGQYYGPDGPGEWWGSPTVAATEPQARDEAAAQKLWDISSTLTGVTYR